MTIERKVTMTATVRIITDELDLDNPAVLDGTLFLYANQVGYKTTVYHPDEDTGVAASITLEDAGFQIQPGTRTPVRLLSFLEACQHLMISTHTGNELFQDGKFPTPDYVAGQPAEEVWLWQPATIDMFGHKEGYLP